MASRASWTLVAWVTAGIGAAALAPALVSCYSGDALVDSDQSSLPGEGATIYAQQCARCHGPQGEGNQGPSLRHWTQGEPAMESIISQRMPLDQPGTCTGGCAKNVAEYILAALQGDLQCDAPKPTPRVLRLLTRREYKATIADLFGDALSTTAPPSTCDVSFHWDPKGRSASKVHVAGSFNGWAPTAAAGGYSLALMNGVWSTVHAIPPGSYPYKFVVDEVTWLVDPDNPRQVSDGLGGQNSLLDVSCSGNNASIDVTASMPTDTRPEGFLFDTNGPGRVVTDVAVGEYYRAASVIASTVQNNLAKVIGCDPNAKDCGTSFVRDFGARVFRRPLTGDEIARYGQLVSGASDAKSGVTLALRAMLVSPSFLYRTEIGETQRDGGFALTPWEIASALSYGLWGTMPDAALFQSARSGGLSTAAGIEHEARRLLADPRARPQFQTFVEQWLGAENIPAVDKSDAYQASPELRQSMLEETRRFVTDVVFDGSHDLRDLFRAKYTFADDALVAFYGLGGSGAVSGGGFRKVPLGERAGLLGHASILATTAHSDQTSPIRRGLFVRRRLLCQDFPPPPANAGGVPKVDPNATTRERFAQHTNNAFCKNCHQYIDDVGFGFEHYDPIGRARDQENGKPIDATGDMNDVEGLGTHTHAPYKSLDELGGVLAGSHAAKACVVRQYWRFVRGQREEDGCQTHALEGHVDDPANGTVDARELLVAIYTDPRFLIRR
jgi:mono/diheme cytochrome c family protein